MRLAYGSRGCFTSLRACRSNDDSAADVDDDAAYGGMGTATAAAEAAAAAAETLHQRINLAREAEFDSSMFDGPANCRATIEEFFSSMLVSPPNNEDNANCDHLHKPLLDAFDASYGSEGDFNRAAFQAICDVVGALTRQENSRFRPALVLDGNKKIILEPKRRSTAWVDGEEMEYATGLARCATVPSDSSGIVAKPATKMSGHAWVVFRRPVESDNNDREWKVWVALAAVEFQCGSAVCEGISRTPQGTVDGRLLCPLQAAKHGSLAQVVLHTVAHALRGRAALGDFPSRIPFAAVACKKIGESKEVANGWIHGNLLIPPACGSRFSFNVDAYGTVHNGTVTKDPSIAAYLHVVTDGLRAAQRWLDRLSDTTPAAALPAPHWISGLALHFGFGMPLPDVRLAATPVLKYGVRGLRISQGELFEGTLNLSELRSSRTIQDGVHWCRDEFDGKEQPVLIKVSSMACFNLLIPNRGGYLYNLYTEWEPKSVVRKALAQSLHGFFVTQDENGLIQLLPNLAILGYKPLRPQQWLERDGGWEGLWSAFTRLVNDVLIPLALSTIVHADIRVGYDESFNILYNPNAASMRLIDLDSLCRFGALMKLPPVHDPPNIRPDMLPVTMWTPLGFVLGQVVCAGEVWLREIGHAVVDANDIIEEAVQSGKDVFDAVPTEASDPAVDEELVRLVLKHYGTELETKYSSDGLGSTSPVCD